ncbi:MAG: LytR C-terminal domain-containing protein [Actinomycetota bacterium]
MSAGMPRAPRMRASRLRRREREHHRRSVELMVTVIVVALGVAYATTQVDGQANAGDGSSRPSPSVGRTPALLALSVTGAPKPLLAVVGTAGSPPAAMGVPQGLTLEVPGAGDLTTRRVAALPGDGVQVALSNVVGTWAAHYAITDLAHLATLVDRNDWLRVELPEAVTVDDAVLGPGEVRMTGVQVAAFLGAENQNTFTRWEVVLAGLLAAPPRLEGSDLTETDDVAGVQATLDGAKDGRIETLPVQVAAATVRVPKYSALDELMAERFGVKRMPVPVIVQNAVGTAGVGEAVGRLIIGRGFRITLSQNAVTFDKDVTQIVALGEEHLRDARRVRAALGVGRVAVSQVASGIGDVQIIVGKDFTA